MIIIEELSSCVNLVGKKIKYNNIIYMINCFCLELRDSTNTKHYVMKLINGFTNIKCDLADITLSDDEIRPFFQKCSWVND